MNPKVDHDLCIGCGVCSDVCPEVFEMGDDGLAHVKADANCEAAGCCQEAADQCPTEAISL
ncbi:MAG: ferredoxin [Limnochordia bacterium]|jgi:ferredoxin|nr:ferredoxin [Bacillota bacterium]NLL09084.1 ferredoxin [Bacillota bacterium]HBG08977.1 ferredoxin [Bacillota bacterium]